MNIGIDLRPLIAPYRTGVGEYTFELLSHILALDTVNQYYLFYNSAKNIYADVHQWKEPNVHYVTTHWPNKLFNTAITLINQPYVDRLFKVKLDYFFSSNFNFTAVSPNTKFILTVHDIAFSLFPYFYNYRWRFKHALMGAQKQSRLANNILVPSENTKQDLTRYYKIEPEKITVIYPGISGIFTHFTKLDEPTKNVAKQTIKQKYNLPDNFILYLGTIEPRKNIISIIRAFEQYNFQISKFPNFNLVIAGAPGWKNKPIFEAIKNSPLKDKITYIGYIDHEDKPALYSLASLFVYPSFYEGFGFPVLEALFMGVPVITSNRSSLPEITNSSAYLVNPHRPEEIAEGIQTILTNDILKNTLIKNGLAEVQKFNWDTAAKQWLSIIGK